MTGFFTKIVGVSFTNEDGSSRQQLLTSLSETLEKEEVYLLLERQQNNIHDQNAVAVYSFEGKQLGFLSKQVSETIAPLMDQGTKITATAVTVTGGWPMHYGLNIRLEYSAA